jgi:alkylated DNA repair protein (DNA oxidative demethylase)
MDDLFGEGARGSWDETARDPAIRFTLTREEQVAVLNDVRAIVRAAPLFTPTMPKTGAPFSVRMTNCGRLGWVSDQTGYRYQPTHPVTGAPWPPIPETVLAIWRAVANETGSAIKPEACLINWYQPTARMGLHQDRDEAMFEAPVVSLSLGDTARFRLGGLKRSDPTRSFELRSGDVMALSGPTRLAFHGVDRVLKGTSDLLDAPGRINLTLRRVTAV